MDIRGAKLYLLADSFANESIQDALPLETIFKKTYKPNSFPKTILEEFNNGIPQCKEITFADCKDVKGHLWYRDMYDTSDHPIRTTHLVDKHHGRPAASNPGRAKTLELLFHTFPWPKMRQDVDQ